MVAVLGAQANAGAVTKPEPPLLRLPGRDLQPLAPPDALNPLVVYQPSTLRHQHVHLPWLGDDLFRFMPLPRHAIRPLQPRKPFLRADQFIGRISYAMCARRYVI